MGFSIFPGASHQATNVSRLQRFSVFFKKSVGIVYVNHFVFPLSGAVQQLTNVSRLQRFSVFFKKSVGIVYVCVHKMIYVIPFPEIP
jgi:hypothetical protein